AMGLARQLHPLRAQPRRFAPGARGDLQACEVVPVPASGDIGARVRFRDQLCPDASSLVKTAARGEEAGERDARRRAVLIPARAAGSVDRECAIEELPPDPTREGVRELDGGADGRDE